MTQGNNLFSISNSVDNKSTQNMNKNYVTCNACNACII